MEKFPQVKPKRRTDGELASELLQVIESHFDDLGLTLAQRDVHYAALEQSLNARDTAKRGRDAENLRY